MVKDDGTAHHGNEPVHASSGSSIPNSVAYSDIVHDSYTPSPQNLPTNVPPTSYPGVPPPDPSPAADNHEARSLTNQQVPEVPLLPPPKATADQYESLKVHQVPIAPPSHPAPTTNPPVVYTTKDQPSQNPLPEKAITTPVVVQQNISHPAVAEVPVVHPAAQSPPPQNLACAAWGGVKPNSHVYQPNFPFESITTSFGVLGPWDPPTDVKLDIRFYNLPAKPTEPESTPGYCRDGGCWSCLTSPRKDYSTSSTIETCNHAFKDLIANPTWTDGQQRMGNWNYWKFVKGRVGPDGVQLYDIHSIKETELPMTEVWVPVYRDMVILKIDQSAQKPDNSNAFYTRFYDDNLKKNGVRTFMIVEACTGKVLKNNFGINSEGCVLTKNTHEAGWWSICRGQDDHMYGNNDPIDTCRL
jgi:hypothetical protein